MNSRIVAKLGSVFLIIIGAAIVAGIEGQQPDWTDDSQFFSFSNVENKLYTVSVQNCEDSDWGVDLGGAWPYPSSLTFAWEDENILIGYSEANNRLVHFDLAARDIDKYSIAECDVRGIGGLAYCIDGILYAIPGDVLYTVNPYSCSMSEIGPLGVTLQNRGLACHPETNELYAFGSATDTLYKIDKSTGEAQPVGPLNHDITGGVGIEFSLGLLSTKLYGTLDDKLYEINLSTGAGRYICEMKHGGMNNLAVRRQP